MNLNPTAKGYAQLALGVTGYVAWCWFFWSRFHRWWSIIIGLVAGFATAYAIRMMLGTTTADLYGDPSAASGAAAFLGLDTSNTVQV